jgi:hypothetical protein
LKLHPAVGAPESSVAVDQMIELRNRGLHPKTVGADKGCRDQTFAEGLREQQIEPHSALRKDRSAVEVICTLAHTLSQKCRKKIEEIFGLGEDHGVLPQKPLPRSRTHACTKPIRGGHVQLWSAWPA